LQYQAESKKKDLEVVEKDLTADEKKELEPAKKELTAEEKVEQLKLATEAGPDIKCEFCGNEIRPFPTLDAQKGTLQLSAVICFIVCNIR